MLPKPASVLYLGPLLPCAVALWGLVSHAVVTRYQDAAVSSFHAVTSGINVRNMAVSCVRPQYFSTFSQHTWLSFRYSTFSSASQMAAAMFTVSGVVGLSRPHMAARFFFDHPFGIALATTMPN